MRPDQSTRTESRTGGKGQGRTADLPLVRKWDLSQAGGSSGWRASATRYGAVRVGVVAGLAGCGQVAGAGGDGLDCALVAEAVQALGVCAGLAGSVHEGFGVGGAEV